LVEQFGLKKISQVVAGGDTRAQSVRNGLAAIERAEIVAVHDGVRPLVTPDEIDSVVRVATEPARQFWLARLATPSNKSEKIA